MFKAECIQVRTDQQAAVLLMVATNWWQIYNMKALKRERNINRNICLSVSYYLCSVMHEEIMPDGWWLLWKSPNRFQIILAWLLWATYLLPFSILFVPPSTAKPLTAAYKWRNYQVTNTNMIIQTDAMGAQQKVVRLLARCAPILYFEDGDLESHLTCNFAIK